MPKKQPFEGDNSCSVKNPFAVKYLENGEGEDLTAFGNKTIFTHYNIDVFFKKYQENHTYLQHLSFYKESAQKAAF